MDNDYSGLGERPPSLAGRTATPLTHARAFSGRTENVRATGRLQERAPRVQDWRKLRIGEQYPRIASELLNPLLDLLTRSRDACGGDVEKFLIVLAVAIRTAQHPEFKALSQEQLLSGEIEVFPTLRTNIRSIADSMGMPKETVRRKVLELSEAGWMMRDGRDVFFTTRAYQELVPVRESIERLAFRHFEVISACLEGDLEVPTTPGSQIE